MPCASNYFAVAAIFKNESFNLKEWLDHYFFHGADHVFLINDQSDDDFEQILNPYIKENKVTLFNSLCPKIQNRQQVMYDSFILPIIKDYEWMLICDLDEFLYSPKEIDLKEVLKKHEETDCLYVNWAMFGSSNCLDHPKSIVQSNILRMEYNQEYNGYLNGTYIPMQSASRKYIVNKNANISGLWVHDPIGSGLKTKNISYLGQGEDCDLIMNHYITQSKEFWENVKMKRGDVNNHHPDNARDWKYFDSLNIGEIEDFRLAKQNS